MLFGACTALNRPTFLNGNAARSSENRVIITSLSSSENGEDSRPPIIPFDFGADFARADIIVKTSTTYTGKNATSNVDKDTAAKQLGTQQDVQMNQNTDEQPSNIFDVLFSDSSTASTLVACAV